MAIEKEQLLEILGSEGDASVKAESLKTLIDDDFEAQLTAIKLNREEIKEEKKQEIAKRKAIEEQLVSLKAESAKLEEQLKSASPDEIKKVFEQKLQDAANIHEKKILEMQATSDIQKSRIQELESIQLMHECEQEFNKAISGKNISPDCLNDFKDFVLGFNCCKFTKKPYGEGQSILATKDGLTIKQVVDASCNTTFGKNCMLNNSFGGGAEGGTNSGTSTNNPFKKETFNLTEQGRLWKEDSALARTLQAQAGL